MQGGAWCSAKRQARMCAGSWALLQGPRGPWAVPAWCDLSMALGYEQSWVQWLGPRPSELGHRCSWGCHAVPRAAVGNLHPEA